MMYLVDGNGMEKGASHETSRNPAKISFKVKGSLYQKLTLVKISYT